MNSINQEASEQVLFNIKYMALPEIKFKTNEKNEFQNVGNMNNNGNRHKANNDYQNKEIQKKQNDQKYELFQPFPEIQNSISYNKIQENKQTNTQCFQVIIKNINLKNANAFKNIKKRNKSMQKSFLIKRITRNLF